MASASPPARFMPEAIAAHRGTLAALVATCGVSRSTDTWSLARCYKVYIALRALIHARFCLVAVGTGRCPLNDACANARAFWVCYDAAYSPPLSTVPVAMPSAYDEYDRIWRHFNLCSSRGGCPACVLATAYYRFCHALIVRAAPQSSVASDPMEMGTASVASDLGEVYSVPVIGSVGAGVRRQRFFAACGIANALQASASALPPHPFTRGDCALSVLSLLPANLFVRVRHL